MTDPFTKARITKLLSDWKQKHGRDISQAELLREGFSEEQVHSLVRDGILSKYQVTAKGGRTENRFKLPVDWRGLRT
jgi:hypothetical protein